MKEQFESLMTRLSPTLKRITHRLNGHFTFFNDDDLCQEALAHMWVAFKQGKLSDKTDSYILQGCYYHLKNYIRTSMDKSDSTSLERPVDEDGTMLEEMIASRDRSLPDQFEDKVLREEIVKYGLSEREVELIDLCMEGLTTRQIGQKMGISHVAVVKLRNKVRDRCIGFKKELKKGYQN